MKITTLRERIQKKKDAIQKKEALILKKQETIEKKTKALKKIGLSDEQIDLIIDNYYHVDQLKGQFTQDQLDKIFDLGYSISWAYESITTAEKNIPELKKSLEKMEAQLAGELKKESIFTTEIPETMKTMEAELVKEWDRWDVEKLQWLEQQAKELGYKEFVKKFSYAKYDYICTATEEDIHEANVKFAHQEVLDLYNRIKEITGEVTDWKGIRCERGNGGFPVLTGRVIGKEGTAIVETILAGGYNIQRLHVRTLVHAI